MYVAIYLFFVWDRTAGLHEICLWCSRSNCRHNRLKGDGELSN